MAHSLKVARASTERHLSLFTWGSKTILLDPASVTWVFASDEYNDLTVNMGSVPKQLRFPNSAKHDPRLVAHVVVHSLVHGFNVDEATAFAVPSHMQNSTGFVFASSQNGTWAIRRAAVTSVDVHAGKPGTYERWPLVDFVPIGLTIQAPPFDEAKEKEFLRRLRDQLADPTCKELTLN